MHNDEEIAGIIYVLTNPAMPGLVKIGKTSRGTVDARLGELYSTGVPVPFECAFAGRVVDEAKVEKAFHLAFGPYRVNPKREFFQIEPEQAIALLELMVDENVTPQLQREADEVDVSSRDASRKLKARRPVQNYIDMGIPVGGVLEFISSDAVCHVASGRKVLYEGEEYSLTGLTKKLLDIETAIQPSPYWTYKGRKLIDIYDDTYDYQ